MPMSVCFKRWCMLTHSVAYRGEFGIQPPPPPKFRRPSKIVPNSTRLWKLLKLLNLWCHHPKMLGKKGSKILKLPPVRNCFTLAMTNKLVVIIIVLKYKNEENFTIWNDISCTKLQLPPEPLTNGLLPQIPVLSVLCLQLNLLNPPLPPRTKFLSTPLDIILFA